jgi:NAD(P)-dependent dehydrogenase (short-subunit alcohol dehydrogenase family)
MPSLTGKIALITGASSGIGFGIAEHFATLGASIVVHGHHPDNAQAAAARLESAGHDCHAVAADLRDVAACRQMMHAAIAWKGGLDVLVNNAGMTDRGYLEDAPVELWDDIMAVNLRAPFICLQEAVTSMKSRGGGSIVNIGSVNAYIGAPKLGPYSVSKGGLMTMTRNAAAALNRYRIRVNQLNVGWTLTEGENAVQEKQGTRGDWLADAVGIMPFGRLLTPREIAYAAAYFASDESALITGGVLDMEQMPIGAPADW